MRTWRAAERVLRQEASRSLRGLGRDHELPLLIAVGGQRPDAVIALGDLDPDDPMETVAGLAALACGFAPSRALVGVLVPSPRRRGGMLAVCDARAVPDGFVTVTRVWAWIEVAGRVWWLGVEVTQWDSPSAFLSGLAETILRRGRGGTLSHALPELVGWTRAQGHRVRLARSGPRVRAGSER